MMQILITGAGGQLATELVRALERGETAYGPLPAAYQNAQVTALSRDELDITDAKAVEDWFKSHAADIVFNAAAYTNVDGCEQHEADAFAVNAIGSENLAKAVQRTGGKLVHVSTDYVFDGTQSIPRKEKDPVNPVSAYGRTKLTGEVHALAACEKTFVVRTAWLYGAVGKNFVKTMLRLARANGAIKVVADQVGSPTNAADLADALLRLATTDAYGLYHAVNAGTCSWFDFASRIVDLKGVPCEKTPLTSAQYKAMFPASADRPAYSCLDTSKLTAVLGRPMRPWQDALAQYLSENDL